MKGEFDLASDNVPTEQYQVRISEFSWSRISTDLDAYGAAVLPGLLGADECKVVNSLFVDPTLSRTSPIAEQRGWGNGDYRYFRYPMPALIHGLRTALYPHLAPIANAWNERMDLAERYPTTHREFLQVCHRAGQALPTSALLEHVVGQQSLLHQDLYGDHIFPLQVSILLSQPGEEFIGGEFVITEQRPRMQTRPEVVTLNRGDAVILAVSNRPVTGTRGSYRVNLRHGFSKIREGQQRALSIVFHDAAA
jgi:uncharacterized protein